MALIMDYNKVRSNVLLEFKMQTYDFDVTVKNHGLTEARMFINHMRQRILNFETEVNNAAIAIGILEKTNTVPDNNDAGIKAVYDNFNNAMGGIGMMTAKSIVEIINGQSDPSVRNISLRG